MRPLTARAVALCLGLVVALGLAEGVARVREGGQPLPGHGYAYDADWPYQWHPVIGRTAIPGKTVWSYAGGALVSERYNALGFLGPETTREKPAGTFRILALGDSFTEGREVEHARRYVALLERSLTQPGRPVEAINAGRGGYAPSQFLLTYTEEGRSMRPDLVVVFYFIGDLTRAIVDGPDRPIPGQPVFSLESGELRLIPPLRPTKSLDVEVKDWLGYRFALYRLAAAAWHALPMNARAASRELPKEWLAFKREQPAFIEKAWSVNKAILEQLKKEVTADGARLAVVVIPWRMQVEPDVWRSFMDGYDLHPAEWDTDLPDREMARVCEQAGLECLDLLSAFRSFGSGAYLEIGHFSAAGHTLVATLTADWLAARGLVTR